MWGECGRLLCAALVVLALGCRVQGAADDFRLLIQRPHATAVFSGDFDHGKSRADPLSSLQRTFAGSIVPLEVFAVNNSTLSPHQLCEYLQKFNPEISVCEPDFKVSVDAASATPNDPLYNQQWNMQAIKVPTVWSGGQFGDPNRQVRVCMVDTGIDVTHPDLIQNLWINQVEMKGPGATAANGYKNGIDDDGNGIIDDIYGADFVNGGKDGNIQDQNGHGTFVAGVVGAVSNNALGVVGINQYASIVGCRFMDATGNGWVSDAIRCWEYCMSKDTAVLSNSWGGVDYSQALQAALNELSARGALVVASSGNDGQDTDATPHYPSSLPDDIILSVGASTRQNALWARSNYGTKTVQVMAPGVNVLSTGLGGLYIQLTGTSMATPHVAGTAALMIAQYLKNGWSISTVAPNKGLATQVKKLIISTSTKVNGASISGGLLNTAAAVAAVPLKPNVESVGAFSSDFGPQENTTLPNVTFPSIQQVYGNVTFNTTNPGVPPAPPSAPPGNDSSARLPLFPIVQGVYSLPAAVPASGPAAGARPQPWDIPSNRPLGPSDSLASIERTGSQGPGPAAAAESANPAAPSPAQAAVIIRPQPAGTSGRRLQSGRAASAQQQEGAR
ncbi:g9651 [Coccomyxa viridis]|uniref:G9651 protein n=1 Tax=Coccomyxa viridis TaxID=1274662 RepID=A0ABP1G3J3_9CHLO